MATLIGHSPRRPMPATPSTGNEGFFHDVRLLPLEQKFSTPATAPLAIIARPRRPNDAVQWVPDLSADGFLSFDKSRDTAPRAWHGLSALSAADQISRAWRADYDNYGARHKASA